MKISVPSYDLKLLCDGKTLINVGGSVRKYDLECKTKPSEIIRFTDIQNPSEVAISSNEELLAIRSTCGEFALCNLDTGELIYKHKGFKTEGSHIWFASQDSLIIATDWSGRIYTLDVQSKQFELIEQIKGEMLCPFIQSLDKDKYFYFSNGQAGQSSITPDRIMSFDIKSCQIKCLYSDYMRVIDNSVAVLSVSDKIYYVAVDRTHLSRVLMCFNCITKQAVQMLDIDQKMQFFCEKENYNYLTAMAITQNEKYGLIGFSNGLIVTDLHLRKILAYKKIKYLSSLTLTADDSQVIVGTWSGIFWYDIFELIGDTS